MDSRATTTSPVVTNPIEFSVLEAMISSGLATVTVSLTQLARTLIILLRQQVTATSLQEDQETIRFTAIHMPRSSSEETAMITS